MLPEPLLSFWYEFEALNQAALTTGWGAVVTDDRFPLIWQANKASVLEPSPGLRLEEIREALHPALKAAGAGHEHIEFWDVDQPSRALKQLASEAQPSDADVLMVFEGYPTPLSPPGVEVRELRPDEEFWSVYRDTRNDFGGAHTEEVVTQMVSRDRAVMAPAGLRPFAGLVDGQIAGFASLISLSGVGYVDNVVTRQRFRRRGVASACVTEAVKESLDGGDASVHLLAEKEGLPRRLYERLGFRVLRQVAAFTRPLLSPAER